MKTRLPISILDYFRIKIMSVVVIAVATESGVPIFTRKRGGNENIQFSTTAALHGINVFSKCHNVSVLETYVDNGTILWKEYSKTVTLIGIATGGLECDLALLLSTVYDTMIFCIGKKELENLKNLDQIKRDLRQCYPILDFLLESLDPTAVMSVRPTLTLDLIECMLCPQAQQLQQALDQYTETVGGRWACLSIYGRVAATSSDWCQLDPREARLLLLTSNQDGVPLRDTPVYLPYMSPNVAYRAVTCKLLADVYVVVVCGPTPALAQVDELVLACWEGYASVINEAKLTHPRNFPSSVAFESCVLAVLVVNTSNRKCAVLRGTAAGGARARSTAAHRLDVLRTFYVRAAREIAPELMDTSRVEDSGDSLSGMCESYWSSEYHKCHARRSGPMLCCVLYASAASTHTMRFITSQIIHNLSTNKDIYW